MSSVAIGLLGYASFPLFVLGLERLLLGRRSNRAEMLTALLVVAGLALLVPVVQPRRIGRCRGSPGGWSPGSRSRCSPCAAAGSRPTYTPLGDRVLAEPFAALRAACRSPWSAGTRCRRSRFATLTSLVVLGVFCTALAHTLFIASLRRVSAHTASVVAALEPVYGIALAAWLLSEVPTLRTLAGAALIVGAAILATTPSERMNGVW